MKDEKKHHGAVDEPSLEQQFRKLDMLCEKSGAILLVLEGLTQAGGSETKYVTRHEKTGLIYTKYTYHVCISFTV